MSPSVTNDLEHELKRFREWFYQDWIPTYLRDRLAPEIPERLRLTLYPRGFLPPPWDLLARVERPYIADLDTFRLIAVQARMQTRGKVVEWGSQGHWDPSFRQDFFRNALDRVVNPWIRQIREYNQRHLGPYDGF